MPVDSKHPQYAAHEGQWQRCRDVYQGSDAVKARGGVYLPKLEGQDSNGYSAYLMRALFFNATRRTVGGLSGSVFRKAPSCDVPESVKPYLQDVTLGGVIFDGFAKNVFEETLITGRHGVLVEFSEAAQRPYVVQYDAEQIVNWRIERIKGDAILTMVVLRETKHNSKESDVFETTDTEQYRVLYLDAGVYKFQVYQQNEATKKWEVVLEGVPARRGAALTFIPFVFINPNSISAWVEDSPILDLVDVNLSHYRSSADLEHGRHFTALPTPWVAGFPVETVLKIGSGTAWVSDNPEASAGMLEFTGQGLQALEKALEQKQAMMVVVGARLLAEEKRVAETAETMRLRQSGETSVLRSMANTLTHALTIVMGWFVWWAAVDKATVTVSLNRDFMETRLTPQEQSALIALWQGGGIAFETLYFNLERGEISRPGIKVEEEKALIDSEGTARDAAAALLVGTAPEDDPGNAAD